MAEGRRPPGSEVDDATLLGRMARGDASALADLYDRHAVRLASLAMAVLGDRTEAEDVIHDVFLEAWQHAAAYDASRGTVRTWLNVRARSRALDRLRAAPQARRASLSALNGRAAGAGVSTEGEGGRDAALLRQALSEMPEPQREVLLLGYFRGLSSAEISAEIQVPVGTVKSRTRAALQWLRSHFDAAEERT
jgi:RNA polymerase sigma-70 factor, ECF subfamily